MGTPLPPACRAKRELHLRSTRISLAASFRRHRCTRRTRSGPSRRRRRSGGDLRGARPKHLLPAFGHGYDATPSIKSLGAEPVPDAKPRHDFPTSAIPLSTPFAAHKHAPHVPHTPPQCAHVRAADADVCSASDHKPRVELMKGLRLRIRESGVPPRSEPQCIFV